MVVLAWTGGFGFRCHCNLEPGRIRSVTMHGSFDPQTKTLGLVVATFSPLQDRLVTAVVYENLEPESEVRVRWYFLDKRPLAANAFPKMKRTQQTKREAKQKHGKPWLFRTGLKVVDGTGRVTFGATRRRGPWPSGHYEVITTLDGKVVAKVRFEVSAKTEYRIQCGSEAWPVSMGTTAPVSCRVEVLNPLAGKHLRIVWKRAGVDGAFHFFAESPSLVLKQSRRYTFTLPRPALGYCPGIYRIDAFIDDESAATRVFWIAGRPRTSPLDSAKQ
ncbi:MAG: hypothetical protein J7M25_11590 [Deltaproteobacteria bacterium]|nr:hypothetical protein [Deltaproteobacteria bacterium]